MSEGIDSVAIATLAVAAATALLAYAAWLAARTASRQLSRDMRPVVVPTSPDEKTRGGRFIDGKPIPKPSEAVYTARHGTANYLSICLRNIGTGIAVVRGLRLCVTEDGEREPTPADFSYSNRAMYMAPADTGYLTNLAQDADEDWFGPALKEGITSRSGITFYILYTDLTNNQPAITRMELQYHQDSDAYYASEVRDWGVRQKDWKRVRSRVGR